MKSSQSLVALLLMLPLFLVSCAVSKSSDGFGLTPSIYYKPTIVQSNNKCSLTHMRDLITPQGDTLTSMCESDYKQCLMQGSCFVQKDGTMTSYNYHSTIEGIPRFVEVDLTTCPFGYGAYGDCLDPYFSVAADLSYHKVGDVIFIPRLVDAILPNGEIHDGFVIVRDSGGAITGRGRFDFFTGFYNHLAKENTLATLGFGDTKNRFDYRLATDEEAQAARDRRNFPGLKPSVVAEGIR
ncbi:murein transglycosylase [Bdellovibrio bacteriovorus]|uniref:Murein transglycosylase n=1 Tax=Bdellovibrio bacteriovorus TaxID=959 RepID=A0A162H1D2_BDEBC|nr:3D domain-containing protein [Bdellovibrio bacteriovorus]KYG69427.1 murein transglycosylase [Bdellovibrio bacteriovorus]